MFGVSWERRVRFFKGKVFFILIFFSGSFVGSFLVRVYGFISFLFVVFFLDFRFY